MISRDAGLVVMFVRLGCLAACSTTRVRRRRPIRAAHSGASCCDPAQYEQIRDMRNWRNPYLIVRADGVALLDTADSAEIILKPDDLLPALAKLPASNWPYGRVVAA